MPFCVRSLSTSFCTALGGTISSCPPATMMPDEGQGARKLKSYMFAGGATDRKPRISGRRIKSCIPIHAPKLKPAIHVVCADRTRVGSGKRVAVRVDLGGRRIIKQKKKK